MRWRRLAFGDARGLIASSRSNLASSPDNSSSFIGLCLQGDSEFLECVSVSAGRSIRADSHYFSDLRKRQLAVDLESDQLALLDRECAECPFQLLGPLYGHRSRRRRSKLEECGRWCRSFFLPLLCQPKSSSSQRREQKGPQVGDLSKPGA